MKTLGVIAVFALTATLHGQLPFVEDEVKKPEPTPDFGLMPTGSVLRRLKLPRYSKENKLEQVATINQLTIISETELDARDMEIQMLDEKGERVGHAEVKFATINKISKAVKVVDDFHFEHTNYSIDSRGLLFNLQEQRGIFFGPVKTTFKRPVSQVNNFHKTLPSLAAMLILPTSSLIAEPAPPSAEEIAKIESAAQPSKEIDHDEPTDAIIKRNEEQSKAAKEALTDFIKSAAPEIQTIVQNDAPAATADAEKKEPAEEPVKSTASQATITCDGGMFMDAEKGIIVYRKNVNIDAEMVDKKNQRTPFSLDCDDEMKIFLRKKEKAKNKDGKGSIGDIEFSEVKEAIATGNAIVRMKDTKKGGPDLVARAEEVFYDGASQSFILRGGRPSIQQGTQSVKALKEGLTIRVSNEGVVMSGDGNGKNWETKVDLPENQ